MEFFRKVAKDPKFLEEVGGVFGKNSGLFFRVVVFSVQSVVRDRKRPTMRGPCGGVLRSPPGKGPDYAARDATAERGERNRSASE